MIHKFIAFLLCLFILASCAPTPMMIKTHPLNTNFEKTPKYNIQDQINNLPKPDKLNQVYVKIDGDSIQIVQTVDQATHILLSPSEYSKIGALLRLAKSYKAIVLEQENLVNTHIDQINGLKELLKLETEKSVLYQELYVDSENAYRLEKHNHKIDNAINKGQIYFLLTGTIILAICAL